MSGPDAFPDTQRTWLAQQSDRGLGERVRNHLMSVYSEPLQRLCRSRLRLPADGALDLVHGFFASRFTRADYLAQWERRDMRLRTWLWRGLQYFVMEQRRAERRLRTVAELPEMPDERLDDPAEEMDRWFAISLVRTAIDRARSECSRDGFETHWKVFERHRIDGETVARAASGLGVPPNRAVVMLRAPTLRFRQAVTDLLIADGVPPGEVPRALRELEGASC